MIFGGHPLIACSTLVKVMTEFCHDMISAETPLSTESALITSWCAPSASADAEMLAHDRMLRGASTGLQTRGVQDRRHCSAPVVGMDGSAHSLNDDQVGAHSRIRQRLWNSAQIQAGAALAVAAHIQPRLPAPAPQHTLVTVGRPRCRMSLQLFRAGAFQ